MGMVERGDGLRFALKAVAGLLVGGIRQELQRHEAVQPLVAGLVHFAHAAGAELLQ
jgi:hypothetical protein